MFEISILISFTPPQLEWWAFLIMAIGVFGIFLLVNFFVKKMNDTRIEERYRAMYERSTNQGTQITQSLELRVPEQTHKRNVSFVYDKEENLKPKRRENLVKSGPNFLGDKYISDWMVVYGRNKSNSNLENSNNITEIEREDLKLWMADLINCMLDKAFASKGNITP